MSERFGVVRGLSSEDAYSWYALLYFGSDAAEGHVWHPGARSGRCEAAVVHRPSHILATASDTFVRVTTQ
jgi:hypothetical protein